MNKLLLSLILVFLINATVFPQMASDTSLFPSSIMIRESSGTSWLPEASPLETIYLKQDSWELMMQGNVSWGYNSQNFNHRSLRGDHQWGSTNWLMGRAKYPMGENSILILRMVLSFDRLTTGGSGYPLLFQTGETWQGKALVDRQHPQDLFSELSLGYRFSFGKDTTIFAYFGLPGEPALGPTAFMFRPSSRNNPDAPLGYHWQDATHITSGVATLGFILKPFKLDMSLFTGREPDEDRFNLDKPRLDSRSIRISWNLGANFAIQLSHAFINSPEANSPEIDLYRYTGSLIYSRPLQNGNLDFSLICGLNQPTVDDQLFSILGEANYRYRRSSLYFRAEIVQKSADDLGFPEYTGKEYWLGAWTTGIAQQFISSKQFSLFFGAQLTVNRSEKALHSFYGDWPLSLQIFFRLAPLLFPGEDESKIK
jgi:hypothetical protein